MGTHGIRRLAGSLVLVLVAVFAGSVALAQVDYPKRSITLVVPYPPGGGTDVIGRIVQDKLRERLGQSIIIENRAGAAGSIGTAAVAKAAPDGYTVLLTLSSHTINPAIYSNLSFDTQRDFEPVAMVASLPQILVANPAFPARSLSEVIALAKSKPGSLSFASVGNGSPGHLAGAMLNLRAGTDIVHIPYRGGGPAVTDVVGGQVPLLWVSIPAAAQFVKQGKLRALAVSTLKRSVAFPDVPTVQESGLNGFEVDSWYAAFVPAKTSRAVVDRLNQAFNEVLAMPEIREKLLQQGAEAVGGTPEELGRVVTEELPKWQKLVRDAGIKAD